MFGKLLFCVAALTSAALAQDISIALPAQGTNITAGSNFVVQVERATSSNSVQEISLVIAGMQCLDGCPGTGNGIGHAILYSGTFDPESTNGEGKSYQNFTVTAPNFFQGTMQLNVARFYLEGLYNIAELELADTTVTLTGATG
ncbi:hypothetical protein EV363DRAFT_1362992 [Boletus edulis]|uniref:Uncharacterized protein n=1 Tax=Boletus edulis BED1 TaxID=1328754 RepID=A0AAD4GID0_BOLED|nr:hypothetical protein EV363DRAFT_1362992 [Boletus edulis]KAF8447164.1 hypothetical protein L210DRAFT_3525053 [Boletus edulis BED1]